MCMWISHCETNLKCLTHLCLSFNIYICTKSARSVCVLSIAFLSMWPNMVYGFTFILFSFFISSHSVFIYRKSEGDCNCWLYRYASVDEKLLGMILWSQMFSIVSFIISWTIFHLYKTIRLFLFTFGCVSKIVLFFLLPYLRYSFIYNSFFVVLHINKYTIFLLPLSTFFLPIEVDFCSFIMHYRLLISLRTRQVMFFYCFRHYVKYAMPSIFPFSFCMCAATSIHIFDYHQLSPQSKWMGLAGW